MSEIPSKTDFTATFMAASYQEAHGNMRDVANHVTNHIQFAITIATAVLAGGVLLAGSHPQTLDIASIVFLGSLVMGLTGFFTFVRLISLKSQTALHIARAECWSQYFIDLDPKLHAYFPKRAHTLEMKFDKKKIPFTKDFRRFTHLLAIFNGIIFTLCLLGFGVFISLLHNNITQYQLPTSTIVLCVAIEIAGTIAVYYESLRYFKKRTDKTTEAVDDILASVLEKKTSA